MESYFDHIQKIVIIGDSGVGKSCLIYRYIYDNFDIDTTTTIGVDFEIKVVNIDGKIVKVQIWDTAGQEKFRTIGAGIYRNANGIILAYDVTNLTSFENLKLWIYEINIYGNNFSLMLVGNKTDKENERMVSYEMGQEFADELKIPFFETSPKSGSNVKYAFDKLISDNIKKDRYIKEDKDKIILDRTEESFVSKMTKLKCCNY